MGVWIETNGQERDVLSNVSHPAWVCGLKPELVENHPCYQESHPAWVCGLKRTYRVTLTALVVTPCVGVWIETVLVDKWHIVYRGHTLRGCVD